VDFVALGRTLIADPEWPNKAFAGRTRDIRRCISCNRCWSIFYRHPIRCAINARAGRERAFPMTPSFPRQRVAVVGGGPAGMEAARAAVERGHAVTLFEKEKYLGGQLRLAVVPPWKQDLAGLLVYLKKQVLEKVDVRLGHEAGPEELAEGKFDLVILAAGALPRSRPGPAPPRSSGPGMFCPAVQNWREPASWYWGGAGWPARPPSCWPTERRRTSPCFTRERPMIWERRWSLSSNAGS